jgi:hypothetical protein
MSRESHDSPRRVTLERLKKEAKRWMSALEAQDAGARTRLERVWPDAPSGPTLRDVQLALAREHGYPGWTALKQALMPDPTAGARAVSQYEAIAAALLEAYRTGTPEAMERHYRLTWHRRPWRGMRTYVQLDLGRRPAGDDDDVDITLDDARHLVAIEHGFESWQALERFASTLPGGQQLTARPVRIRSGSGDEARTRDWQAALDLLAHTQASELDAEGQMTDAMLREVSRVDGLAALHLGGSQALTDDGLRHLAGMATLRHLVLDGTAITDRGLAALGSLTALETLSLAGTRVTDEGMTALTRHAALRDLNLMGTRTGDGAIRALVGHPGLRVFRSGAAVTDGGLALLHELPVFKKWHGGDVEMGLLRYDALPNHLALRGRITDAGLERLRGLDGLFSLNIDDASLGITAAGLVPLISLPHLGWLAVDAKDDCMPHIARMPRLRFLGAQDTPAGDDGFAALSASPTLEYIWGRRCHNLRRRGFQALSRMPALRGLSVSCLNVDDAGVAALPDFPALRELMPMDVPNAGYRHVGRCTALEQLVLMYCRNTTDAATEHLTGLLHLSYYFNSYTTITDRTPGILSAMDSLERVTFDACHALTDAGVGRLARLPRLRELRVSGRGITAGLRGLFPATVAVHRDP